MGNTSASNAEADLLCPGRHMAQLGLPDLPQDGQFAAVGNRVHAALFKRDPSGLSVEERETYEACCAIELRLLRQCFGNDFEKAKAFREIRFWAKFKDPTTGKQLEHSGKPDVVYALGTKGLIIEYKALYGEIPVSPENMQLRDQVCLVKGRFVLMDEILAAVIQPKITNDPIPCRYTSQQIKVCEAAMFARVAASNNPNSPRNAGKRQCDFCKAKLDCPEYQKFAGALLPAMLDLLEVPVKSWTPDQRGIWCQRFRVARKWLDTIEDEMIRLMELDPEAVSGFYLKPGSKRETINNPVEVFNRFLKLGGTQEQFMPCVSVTKTKLKEALSNATGARGKALDAGLDALTSGNVTVTQNSPSITAKPKG